MPSHPSDTHAKRCHAQPLPNPLALSSSSSCSDTDDGEADCDVGIGSSKHDHVLTASTPLQPRGGPAGEASPTVGRSPLPRCSQASVDLRTDQPVRTVTPLTKQLIVMEFGDEYYGEVARGDDGVFVPHGRGTLQSQLGKHCYVGGFTKRWRDGYGKLVTERYVLWSRWKMNRPDLMSTARIDYTNGDKYCGFLALVPESSLGQQIARTVQNKLSKFSAWVQSCSPRRESWGELVSASGDRYFGQWDNDMQSGFGCFVAANGDRYIGLFRNGLFHGTGALFAAAPTLGSSGLPEETTLLNGTNIATAAGATRPPQPAAHAWCTLHPPTLSVEYVASMPSPWDDESPPPRGWRGTVFDGVWEEGRFVSDGHVTLPGHTRISAEWKSAAHATSGSVFLPGDRIARAGPAGAGLASINSWQECFHWEPLLSGGDEEAKRGEFHAVGAFRDALGRAAGDRTLAHSVLRNFLESRGAVVNALRIFRRCFYFLYGTCGSAAEIGAGLGANRLGWCYLRNAFGGCIHRGRGRPVTPNDLELALIDIYSLVRTVLRWTYEMMGDYGDVIEDVDCEQVINRWTLDAVLHDVHDVLLNLYAQVHRDREAAVASAVERLRGNLTLDDLGVRFARQVKEERMFNPYADAVHCIEQVAQQCLSFTSKLDTLVQWSREIDLATRMAQMPMEEEHVALLSQYLRRGSHASHADAITLPEEPPQAPPSSSTPPPAQRPPGGGGVPTVIGSQDYEAGSADDLLPIHQFVLTQARVPHLLSTAQLLADFSCDGTFIDTTSQESFCITTLQACVSMLPQIHPLLRDEAGVLIPVSLLEGRVAAAVRSLEALLESVRQLAHTVTLNAIATPEDILSMARGYVSLWLPELLDAVTANLAAAGMAHPPGLFPLSRLLAHPETPLQPMYGGMVVAAEQSDAVAHEQQLRIEIAVVCLTAAWSILHAAGIALFVRDAAPPHGAWSALPPPTSIASQRSPQRTMLQDAVEQLLAFATEKCTVVALRSEAFVDDQEYPLAVGLAHACLPSAFTRVAVHLQMIL